MFKFKRRDFLKMSGSTLATLGLSQLDIIQQGNTYHKALAKSQPCNKFALLVGIDQYRYNPLRGCVMDVQLQQKLLQYRYGFNPDCIKILTDVQATRQNILQEFETHLIQQASPGDVVVFHFSGHGSLVDDHPECDAVFTQKSNQCLNGSLVPIDGDRSLTNRSKEIVKDITGHTLFLLMAALDTENVTVILDSCYSGGGTRGSYVVRALPRNSTTFYYSGAEEQAEQEKWLTHLKLTKQNFIDRRREGVAKGTVLASATQDQEALDANFGQFYAGVFTYNLTRYLWQQGQSLGLDHDLIRINLSTKIDAYTKGRRHEQNPIAEYAPKQSEVLRQKPFLQQSPSTPFAEAVVTSSELEQFSCWLGGMTPSTLQAVSPTQPSVFSILDPQNKEKGEVILTNRKGLIGQGKVLKGSLQEGDLLQEKVHSLALDQPLDIGLDQSLSSEANVVKLALSKIPLINPIPSGQGGVYLLGKMTPKYRRKLAEQGFDQLPPLNSIGLFSPSLDSIVRDSFNHSREPVPQAIKRLTPRFTMLRMTQLLKQLLNPNTSQLSVDAVVTTTSPMTTKNGTRGAGQAIVATGTRAKGRRPGSSIGARTRGEDFWQQVSNVTEVRPEDILHIEIKNDEPFSLYLTVLTIDPSGRLIVLFPFTWEAPSEAARVAAHGTLLIPETDAAYELVFQPPTGLVEILVLCSSNDLRPALKGLKKLAAKSTRGQREPLPIEADVETVVKTLVGNFGRERGSIEVRAKNNQIPVDTVAALSFALQIVKEF